MSSVLVKGMAMPENCEECPCYRHDSMDGAHAYQCNVTLKVSNWGLTERPSDCPLVEVKTPHGDLIDSSEIRWVEHHDSDGNLSKYMVAYSDEMPQALIEAEGRT